MSTTYSDEPRILVMALGNTLRGDDGVGAAVLNQLDTSQLPSNVTILDAGTPGLELVVILQEYDRVIIIDAADMGKIPGYWRQFTPDEVRLASRDMHLRGTLHYAGLAEALSLGNALELLPHDIIIFGVQPQSIDWVTCLSAPVEACVADIAGRIELQLKQSLVAVF